MCVPNGFTSYHLSLCHQQFSYFYVSQLATQHWQVIAVTEKLTLVPSGCSLLDEDFNGVKPRVAK